MNEDDAKIAAAFWAHDHPLAAPGAGPSVGLTSSLPREGGFLKSDDPDALTDPAWTARLEALLEAKERGRCDGLKDRIEALERRIGEICERLGLDRLEAKERENDGSA